MKSFRTLSSDRRGNVAMIFALLTPVFVLTSGMAVDTSRIEASKWSMQHSIDAAALGAAKQFGMTPDPVIVGKWASSLFFANEGRDPNDNTAFKFEGVKRIDGNNVLRVSATRDERTYFGGAVKALTGGQVDFETWHISVFSEVIVQNRSVELALVLDNSGSMSKSPAGGGATKITTLKTATEKLVTQMLVPQPTANAALPVQISVVPFSGAVNVGTKYATAPWMDTEGVSPMHHDDIDWSTWKVSGVAQATRGFDGAWRQIKGNTPLTRFTLFEKMRVRNGTAWGWGGCVASRPNGYAVTDDVPAITNPATLFLPLFMPSEYNWSGSLTSVKNDYLPETATAASTDLANLARQRDVMKYMTTPTMDGGAAGPDSLCNTAPITPLSATQSSVVAAVRAMVPLGGTNIAEGLGWGWRTLTSGEPFTEGRPRSTKENLKVLVLMTDGENTYNAAYATGEQVELTNANKSQFGTYGFGQFVGSDGKLRTGRMFEATKTTVKKAAIDEITDAMNETMSIVCENIKKDGTNDDGGDGIVIFTIAFDLKDGSPVKERLRNCASKGIDGRGDRLYYDAKNSNDLLVAFSAITDEISALRIAR